MAAKKEVNTELVAKAESCFQIANEIQNAITAIVEAGGECDDNTLETLQEWQAKLEVKAENIGHVAMRLSLDCEYYKAVEEAARAKRKAIELAEYRLKKYLRDCMISADQKSLKGTLFTFTVSDGRASANISDENKLPSDLVEIVEVVKPKKKEILERLEALPKGEQEIPGAQLVYGEKYLAIRKAGKNAE